jgi:hypothetical protein
VAACWLGIGGAVAALSELLCECRRACIGAALWQCVRHAVGWIQMDQDACYTWLEYDGMLRCCSAAEACVG